MLRVALTQKLKMTVRCLHCYFYDYNNIWGIKMNLAELRNDIEKFRGDLDRDIYIRVGISLCDNAPYIEWSISFRHNSRTGAFSMYGAQVRRANEHIAQIGKRYESLFKVKYEPCTLEKCEQEDDDAHCNGDDPHSEYEQSISGSISFYEK